MAFNLLITYDLDKPGQNYDAVRNRIETLGKWLHVQRSVYYLHTTLTAQEAHSAIWSAMDINDRLIVADVAHMIMTPVTARNIIVHGLIHKSDIQRPCWTVFRGIGKGKNFPASVEAATIVAGNIHKLAFELSEFNARHQYKQVNPTSERIESGWPRPL